MSTSTGLPSIWRLAWMLFMQPTLLHRQLAIIGINEDAPGWHLWRIGKIHKKYN